MLIDDLIENKLFDLNLDYYKIDDDIEEALTSFANIVLIEEPPTSKGIFFYKNVLQNFPESRAAQIYNEYKKDDNSLFAFSPSIINI